MTFTPVGFVRSPHEGLADMPIQPAGALGYVGFVDVLDEFRDGLLHLEGFSHLLLVTHLHRMRACALRVRPFLDPDTEHGVFATRAPARPNPIGISVVQLLRLECTRLIVRGVDLVDGTPVLDIKPHVPAFDAPGPVICGWFEAHLDEVGERRSDGRYGSG